MLPQKPVVKRLALPATMLSDPELIILDEPANGLDPQGMRVAALRLRPSRAVVPPS